MHVHGTSLCHSHLSQYKLWESQAWGAQCRDLQVTQKGHSESKENQHGQQLLRLLTWTVEPDCTRIPNEYDTKLKCPARSELPPREARRGYLYQVHPPTGLTSPPGRLCAVGDGTRWRSLMASSKSAVWGRAWFVCWRAFGWKFVGALSSFCSAVWGGRVAWQPALLCSAAAVSACRTWLPAEVKHSLFNKTHTAEFCILKKVNAQCPTCLPSLSSGAAITF